MYIVLVAVFFCGIYRGFYQMKNWNVYLDFFQFFSSTALGGTFENVHALLSYEMETTDIHPSTFKLTLSPWSIFSCSSLDITEAKTPLVVTSSSPVDQSQQNNNSNRRQDSSSSDTQQPAVVAVVAPVQCDSITSSSSSNTAANTTTQVRTGRFSVSFLVIQPIASCSNWWDWVHRDFSLLNKCWTTCILTWIIQIHVCFAGWGSHSYNNRQCSQQQYYLINNSWS